MKIHPRLAASVLLLVLGGASASPPTQAAIPVPDSTPGARTLVGLVTYPANRTRLAVAQGPVNGVSGPAVTADTPFRIASVTKTFTAASVFRLIEQRRFTLGAPVAPLLSPALLSLLQSAGVDASRITVRHLLGHRSGLADYANSPTYLEAVLTNPGRQWTREEQLQIGLAQGVGTPGKSYAYADTNYVLLGDIIERTTGQNLAASFRALLGFARLDLRKTWLEGVEPPPPGLKPRLHSYVQGVDISVIDASFDRYGGGGLVSTADDLTKFFRALFAGRVLERGSLRAMTGAVSGGGFSVAAYALGLMPFYIGNHACYGHEGFGSVVVGHCPTIDYTFVYAAGSERRSGIALTDQGIGHRSARQLRIDTRPLPFGADFERTRCPPELPRGNARLTCGVLAVDEAVGRHPRRRLRVPVVIARHLRHAPTRDPLLVLGGGPGDALLPNLPALLSDPASAATLLEGQDLVAVEYRGVGAANPRLVCDTRLTSAATVAACLDKFSALDVDLTRYHSSRFAADLERLRRSLGARRWHVLGFSYGTRAALTMLRERPQTIASLTLDGVSPPEAIIEDADDFADALDTVFTDCTASPACAAAFPDLKARFVAAMTALNEAPMVIDGQHVDGNAIVRSLLVFQGDPAVLAYFPAALDAFASRDEALIGALVAAAPGEDEALPPDPTFSDALFLSVQCHEAYPFVDRALVQRQAAGADPIRRAKAAETLDNLAICAQWPVAPPRPVEGLPIALRVPTIVLNAQFDLQTPPALGRRLLARNPDARAFEFRGIGHIALQQAPACALSIIADFQRKQDPRIVDASCLAKLPAIDWKTALDAGFLALIAP